MLRDSLKFKLLGFLTTGGIVVSSISPFLISALANQRAFRDVAGTSQSEFDRLLVHIGVVPKSFETLLQEGEAFCTGTPLESQVDELPVIDSRSLQRNSTSLAHPRRLGSFCGTLLGYSEQAHSLEVISQDATDGKPSFYVVSGFGVTGQSPVIQRQAANLAQCASCHQHGGPIFTRGPWSEMDGPRIGTQGTDSQAITNQINQARAQIGLPPWGQGTPGITAVREPTASVFDSSVRSFNLNMQINQACRETCSRDQECQKNALIYALETGVVARESAVGQNPNSDRAVRALTIQGDSLQRILSSLASHWPANRLSQISSVIADRDPSVHSSQGGQTEWVEISEASLFFNAIQAQRQHLGWPALPNELGQLSGHDLSRMLQYDSSNPFFTAFVDPAFALKDIAGVVFHHQDGFNGDSPGNPQVPRPLSNEIPSPAVIPNYAWQSISSFCFGHLPSDFSYLDPFSPDQIRDGVLGTSVEAQTLLLPWPPTREKIQATLTSLLSGSPKPTPSQIPLPEPSASPSITPISPVPSRALERFQYFCSSCHAGGFAPPLPFEDLSSLKAYKNGRVIDRIQGVQGPIMPPLFPTDLPRPSNTVREEMVSALKTAAP